MQEFDVIICGGGPSGSTCALGLFDAGLSVALLEKSVFPREKICGDAYGGYAYKILNTISPDFGKQLLRMNAGLVIKRAKITSPKGYLFELKLKGFFSSLPRIVFDNFLIEMVRKNTKTVVMDDTTVDHISIQSDSVLVTTTRGTVFKCKIIVGCDGAHSIIQSTLTGTRKLLTETCPGLRGYFKNVKGINPDCLEIHFLQTIPKGYFWIFPTPHGLANVGIGADKEVLTNHRINMRSAFQQIITDDPKFKDRFSQAELVGQVTGWTIPIGYFKSKLPISGDRVLLCGDAAALVDPSTGEGIGPAMSSGRYAAKQIKDCFSRANFSAEFMKRYDRQIKAKYARNYRMKSMFASLYYRFPFLLDWAVGVLGSKKSNK